MLDNSDPDYAKNSKKFSRKLIYPKNNVINLYKNSIPIHAETAAKESNMKEARKNQNRIIPEAPNAPASEIIHTDIPNYQFFKKLFDEQIGHHFQINNKIDEINYRQLMEIKLYSQA
jgi:hypothetical protein